MAAAAITRTELNAAGLRRAASRCKDAGAARDGAGWHQRGGKLRMPDNLTLLHLPPYAPQLNPVENIRAYLRGNALSNRLFDGYDATVRACAEAWNSLIAAPKRIVSIANRPWAQVR